MLFAKWKKLMQYDVWVGGTRVNERNKDNILPNQKGRASYNPSTKTLHFDNVNWQNVFGTIGNYNAVVYSEQDLNITGSANISLTENYVSHVSCNNSKLTISGKISFYGGKRGIYATNGVEITGNDTGFVITDAAIGIEAGNTIKISDGSSQVNCTYYGLYTDSGVIDIAGGISNYISGKYAALYGGPNHPIEIGKNVVISIPTKYHKGKYSGQEAAPYYTIYDDIENEPAKIVQTYISKRKFTVRFDLNGKPGTAPADQIVYEGNTATKPTNNPTAEGFRFYYWTTDPAGNNMYDFSTPVKSDLTLYAKWFESSGEGRLEIPDSELN